MAIRPDGHFRVTPGAAKQLRYVVLTDSSEQLTLTPEEFAEKFGWTNDPTKVRLFAEAESGNSKAEEEGQNQ